MTLKEQIDALPEWPHVSAMQKWPDAYSAEAVRQSREQHHAAVSRAALARLALAREWIEGADSFGPVTRALMLKALEGPK